MRVVCAGHLNWDITLRVDRLPRPDDESRVRERRESGGGSAANVARGLLSLSCDAQMLGSVGDDERGQLAVRELGEAGVETHVEVVEGVETTEKYIFVDDDGEVALLDTEGANEALGPEDVSPAVLDDADGVHLTGQRPETAARIAQLASERGLPVSFDPGRRVADRDYTSVFERTDLLFTNDREAAAVDVSVPWQVTKHGADGATLSTPDGTFEHPGFDVDAAVDSTGAGDAFAAGFLSVWLEERYPERALAVGNACGAIAATEHGSTAGLSWERIEQLR